MDFEFLGYRDAHREHAGVKTHWVALDFFVRIDRERAKNNEPHKFDEAGWFPLSALPEPLHSQFPIFFKQYGAKLRL